MDNNDFQIYSKLNKICRTCLEEGDLRPLFGENSIDSVKYTFISDMLMECCSVQIFENDGLPSHICSNCIKQMNNAYSFRQQCIKSDSTLRSFVLKSEVADDKIELISISPEYLTNSDVEINETCNINLDNDSNSIDETEKLITDNNKSQSIDLETNTENVKSKLTKAKPTSLKNKNCTKFIKNKSLKRKFSNPPYKCRKCEDIFTTEIELNDHMKTKKHPYRRILCNICAKPLSFRHIDVHMRTHTKEKPYTCDFCGARFSVNGNLRRHIMTHTGERPHKCDICGKGFIQAISLEEHMRVHTGEKPFVCSYCGKAYKQSKQFKVHVKKHVQPEIYKSEMQKDRKRNDISRRPKVIHSEETERSHVCDICDRGFTTKTILSAHLLTHGDKKFLCSDCGKGFVTKIGLQSHSKVHTGEKPYSCNVCGKTFAHTASLKVHTYVHTGEKPYSCKMCDKRFSQSSHLRTHIRLHSGVKPYSCSICSKHFTLKGNLTVHMRIHMGEKPFTCTICGKGFYDSSSLKKHQNSHSDKITQDINLVTTNINLN